MKSFYIYIIYGEDKKMNDFRAFALNSDEKSEQNLLNNKSGISNTYINSKISGSFNNVEYKLNEQAISISYAKKYIGQINNKKTEYIINPEKDKHHKGKIQGYIGQDNVNLIVMSDLFGKKTLSGLYKDGRIELTVSKNLFGIRIEGKNTDVNIKKNFFSLNKSIEGKFEYDNEIMPLILSYIKYSEDIRKEAA